MLKQEYTILIEQTKKFDTEFINLKIALKNIDKMGVDITDIYKQLDNIGIEMYKAKKMIENNINEHLEIDIKL